MLHFPQNSTKAIRAKNRSAGDPLENLELLSAACRLAPQLYALRGEAFNADGVWTVLKAAQRQHYIDICIEVLNEVKP